MNYYEILKVQKNASSEEIKDSYKNLIKKYHPDVYQGDKEFAEKKCMEINDAYDILSNPEKRAEYDLSLIPPENTIANSYSQSNTYSSNTYKPEAQKETENWTQKFSKKLYHFVDEHTKELSSKTKLRLVLLIIFFGLLFMLMTINDYIAFMNRPL